MNTGSYYARNKKHVREGELVGPCVLRLTFLKEARHRFLGKTSVRGGKKQRMKETSLGDPATWFASECLF